MIKNKIFQLRISQELFGEIKTKNENVSRYIRYLIQKDLQIDRDDATLIPDIKSTTPFTFLARLIEVIDGDTIIVEIDLGFYLKVEVKIRLLGLNAPSIDEPKGMLAKEFVERELTNRQLVIETKNEVSMGAILAMFITIQNT